MRQPTKRQPTPYERQPTPYVPPPVELSLPLHQQPLDLPGERWLPYHDSDFEVSDLGRVRSRAWGMLKLIKGFPNPDGYLAVNWRREGRRFSKLVHRMVLWVFVGPPPSLRRGEYHGCHEYGDIRDNRLAYLRWDTAAGNSLDNLRLGRGPIKLSAEQAKEIHRKLQRGHSARELVREYKVTQVAIVNIGTGRTWGHVTGQRRDAPSASARAEAMGRRVRSKYHWQDKGRPHFVARGTFGDPNLPSPAELAGGEDDDLLS